MVDEDLTEYVAVESAAEHENMLSNLDVHFFDDTFSERHCLDEESGFVGNGGGECIGLVFVDYDEIAVIPVDGLTCGLQAVGCKFVLVIRREVHAFALLHERFLARFGDDTDGESTENQGILRFQRAEIGSDVRFR